VEPVTLTLSVEDISYTYNNEQNRLLSDGDSDYLYDDEGQLSDKDGTAYTFDYEHRLKTIGSTVIYTYDGMGNRLQAVRSGVTTRYIYDASGNLIAEADGNNNITKYYIYGKGLMAMVTVAGDIYCYHFNATGSTIAMTNSSQTVVNKYAYTPFGIISQQVEAVSQPFKYVGQYGVTAEPNGLYYMRARYYDPTIGRFISEDPAGFGGGDVNLYAYVGNNPVLIIDPTGLCGEIQKGKTIMEYYAKVEEVLKPYLVGGGLVVTGGATTVAGALLTGAGFASIPETGPAGVLVTGTGVVVTVTGASQFTLGLDVYADELRNKLGLPEWFDVIHNLELLPDE